VCSEKLIAVWRESSRKVATSISRTTNSRRGFHARISILTFKRSSSDIMWRWKKPSGFFAPAFTSATFPPVWFPCWSKRCCISMSSLPSLVELSLGVLIAVRTPLVPCGISLTMVMVAGSKAKQLLTIGNEVGKIMFVIL